MKKRHSIIDFRLAKPEEVDEYGGGHGILTYDPRGISTFVVYQFLKDHFGRPNGHASLGDPDKVTWEYVLKGPRQYIAIHDWKLHSWLVSIRLPWSMTEDRNISYEEVTKYDDAARLDANILLDEMIKYAKRTKIPVKRYEGQLIDNVFKKHYVYGEYFSKSLEKPLDQSNLPKELSQSFIGFLTIDDLSKAWASIISFMLSVEAMFNIILEIYLRKEISNDKALRQRVFRLSLIDKWLLFASVCTCFSRPLDRKSQGYESLKRLRDIRNSWAHADISDEMRTYIIEEDELIFSTKSSPISKIVQPNINSLDNTWVNKVKEDVDKIKLEVLSAMKIKIKKKFMVALEDERILLTNKGELIL